MAQRAIDLLTDPDRLRQMGRAAAEHVRNKWCAEIVVPQYEACYDSLANTRES